MNWGKLTMGRRKVIERQRAQADVNEINYGGYTSEGLNI